MRKINFAPPYVPVLSGSLAGRGDVRNPQHWSEIGDGYSTRSFQMATCMGINGPRFQLLSAHWADLMTSLPENRTTFDGGAVTLHRAVLAECTSMEALEAAQRLLQGDL